MTLSWGTSYLAVEEAVQSGATRMAVLGCGGVGLAAARLLQQRGIAVTIYAKALPPDTTSNIAGAQWFPFTVFDEDKQSPEFMNQFVRACRFSYRWYQNLVGSNYGVRWIPNYSCSNHARDEQGLLGREGVIHDLLPGVRDLNANEHPFPYPYVREFYTMLMEPAVYLQAVLRDFRIAGGTVVVRDFASREQIQSLPEKTIINCTGLGSRELFGDSELVPIKGQLTVLLPQPEINYIVLASGTYMFPRSDGILLGGTHERGVWSMEPNAEAKAQIVATHTEFFSKMRR
jgi:glycine/D-amino acid oxidase-like deaminating enzyme